MIGGCCVVAWGCGVVVVVGEVGEWLFLQVVLLVIGNAKYMGWRLWSCVREDSVTRI